MVDHQLNLSEIKFDLSVISYGHNMNAILVKVKFQSHYINFFPLYLPPRSTSIPNFTIYDINFIFNLIEDDALICGNFSMHISSDSNADNIKGEIIH